MNLNHLLSLQQPLSPPPSWEAIVAGVSALNGADRPVFTLAPQSGSEDGLLMVQGRPGAYTVTVLLTGQGRFRYFDPNRDGTEEVEICNGDLLFDYVDPRYVCPELTRVLGVVQHFWEYG